MNNYITRELERTVVPFLDRKEVIAIVGPRQAGKTTFVQHLAKVLRDRRKKVREFTFERVQDVRLFSDSIEEFKRLIENDDVVVIDEFQHADDGGQKLKYLYDTMNTKFIVTGSSSLELRFATARHMVGRMVTFRLWPFSWHEFLQARDPDIARILAATDQVGETTATRALAWLEEYMIWGGYPAIVLAKDRDVKTKLLADMLSAYLLKDIKSLLALATDAELLLLARLLATQIGNLVDLAALGKASGLNTPQVKRHLQVLEQTFVLDLVRPFFTNKKKELVKSPKVYFEDLGFRNSILEDFRQMSTRADAGSLVENFVYTHLKRGERELSPISFWRTKSQAEVDFVIRQKQELLPVEVKFQRYPTPGRSLHSFIRQYKPKEAVLLTKDTYGESVINSTKLRQMPVFHIGHIFQ